MEEILLVKQAQRGDADAFGKLYETCYKKLYRYAFYTLQNQEDAEDVVAEAVMDAFASIHKLKEEEAFQSWMFTILANKCKRKRKEYTQKTYELTEQIQDADDLEKAQVTYESQASMEERIDIQTYLLELPEEERQIISLNVFLGYTTREIAQYMEANENTIRSKKSRALDKLRAKLS